MYRAALETWSVDDLTFTQPDQTQLDTSASQTSEHTPQITSSVKHILAVEPSTSMMEIATSMFKGNT